jgi:GxxExxY protein
MLAETGDIYRFAWEVWHKLGNGFTREIYADALELEFLDAETPFERDRHIPIYYKNTLLPHAYTADFIVRDKIVLLVASQLNITDFDKREIAALLDASKLQSGIFINYADKAPQFIAVNETPQTDNNEHRTGGANVRVARHAAHGSDFVALRSLFSESASRVEGGVV